MPKAEFGTTKWMSNKIKASGLQKLRWFCQMCQKQCRDENGFKCHRMSEGHQRMMQVFIQNPNKFMDDFSRDFEREFMRLMRTRYRRARVLANSVYNNIVADRQHIHMNATIWVTLSEFVQYLGSTNKCRIELTPKGWFVEYIDHDELKRLEDLQKRQKEEISQEEAKAKRLEQLVEEAEKRGKYQQPEYTPLVREKGEKLVFGSLKGSAMGETKGELNRPANALKLLEMELEARSRARKRAQPLSASTSERGENKPKGDGESESAVVDDTFETSRYQSNQTYLVAEAPRKEFSTTSSSPKIRLHNSSSVDVRGLGQPVHKQRRLLAMERLRMEEEQKKQRSRGCILPCAQSADDRAFPTGSQRSSYPEGRKEKHARGSGIETKNNGEVAGGDERKGVEEDFSSEAPFRPPPHKYADKDWWLSKNLIVKVLQKTLGEGQYYKRKGRVLKVESRYGGYIQMLDSGAVLRLDQEDLETVIPSIGGWIRVTLGVWRDHEGTLKALETENYCVHVMLRDGPLFDSVPSARPFVLKNLPYEYVCRVEKTS